MNPRGPSLLAAVAGCFLAGLGFAPPAAADEGAPTAPAPSPPAVSAPPYEAVSHRGQHNRHATENGIRALREANAQGADRVEIDVRPTRNGHLIVMHDHSLNRTTNCAGHVSRKNSGWIARHCRLNDGERVPTLATYIGAARSLGQPLMLELKAAPGWKTAVLRGLRSTLEQYSFTDQAVVVSFSPRLLRRVRAQLPTVQTSWIVRRGAPSPSSVRSVATMASISSAYLNASVVAAYDAAGIAVYGRLNDSPTAWERFGKLHLRGSVANNIHGLVAWKRGRAGANESADPVEPPAGDPPADPAPAPPTEPDPA